MMAIYPIAAGADTYATAPSAGPDYSGVFIPEIWSGKLIEKFYSSTVLAAIANTDYEGEIRNQGDTVKIRVKPTVTIRDYNANENLVFERPTSTLRELQINKGKYFNCVLDDVFEVQADIDMLSMWADDASEQMKIQIDTEALLSLVGAANASNRGATAGAISGDVNLGVTTTPLTLVPRNPQAGQTEIIDVITRLGQVLDEQNIPETGRWLIIPAWVASMIKRSELRDASLSGDSTTMLRNGRLGMIDRFTLYMSNLLPAGVAGGLAAGESVIFAGHNHGFTFASQMTKMETLRSESTFGNIMRGLQVYGHNVIDDIALAEAVVTKP